jgi:hypothetical protein
MVLSVPLELNTDHQEIFSISNELGYVSERIICDQRGWPRERYFGVINLLAQEGIAWLDIEPG